jgi:NAD(P) transhydrogenase
MHFSYGKSSDSFSVTAQQTEAFSASRVPSLEFLGSAKTMEANEYDLVVIGMGQRARRRRSAPLNCARRSQSSTGRGRLAASVYTPTIPSKTLREAVLYLSGFRQRSFYGRSYVLKDRIAMSDLVFRAQAVMAREIEVIKAQLRRNQVTTFEGDARFWTRTPSRSRPKRDRSFCGGITS